MFEMTTTSPVALSVLHRQTDRQTDRQTADRQTDRQTDIQTYFK